MQELKQKSFELGQQYYRENKSYPKGTVQSEFLNGIYFEERLSKSSFRYCDWHKEDHKVVSL